MQARDVEWNSIAGLYAPGVDNLPFYARTHRFQMPGSTVVFEPHSGFATARHTMEKPQRRAAFFWAAL